MDSRRKTGHPVPQQEKFKFREVLGECESTHLFPLEEKMISFLRLFKQLGTQMTILKMQNSSVEQVFTTLSPFGICPGNKVQATVLEEEES